MYVCVSVCLCVSWYIYIFIHIISMYIYTYMFAYIYLYVYYGEHVEKTGYRGGVEYFETANKKFLIDTREKSCLLK